MLGNRVILAALGLGAITSGAGSALMLVPEKALAQAPCAGGNPVCKKTEICWKFVNGVCWDLEISYAYYAKT
jgi:hypothetical protein